MNNAQAVPARQADLNYIWVDTFLSAQDAQNAQHYLQSAGVETSVYQLADSSRWVLITKQGFDYRIAAHQRDCDDFVKRIQRLGEDYRKAGGQYDFDCLVKKRKANDRW